MRKAREKEQKIAEQILNRVRFHAPIVFDSSIDRTALFKAGIDPDKPIFKFEKRMTKTLLNAFALACLQEDFSLVVPLSSVENVSQKKLKKIKNLVLFSPESCSLSVFEMVNKLNINYSSSSNYDLKFSEKFLKANGQIINPKFDDYSLFKSFNFDEVSVVYREFVLNGVNFFLKFRNHSIQPKTLEIELNFPLEKGYYSFKRAAKSVRVENLRTHEVTFLNHNARGAKFCFSQVDGLENSTFSCINLRAKISVKKDAFLFVNFGKSSFLLKSERAADKFFEISRDKCREIFDVQVRSKNPKFDQFFNATLPQKIWLGWLDGKQNLLLEEKYLALKKLFVKDGERLDFRKFEALGVREIGIFNGEYYKKILVVFGAEKFFRVGKTYFYNINSILKKSIRTHEPISVCFGEK